MPRQFLLLIVSGLLLMVAVFNHHFRDQKVRLRTKDPSLELKTRMDLAMEQEIAHTLDPAIGFVPRNRT